MRSRQVLAGAAGVIMYLASLELVSRARYDWQWPDSLRAEGRLGIWWLFVIGCTAVPLFLALLIAPRATSSGLSYSRTLASRFPRFIPTIAFLALGRILSDPIVIPLFNSVGLAYLHSVVLFLAIISFLIAFDSRRSVAQAIANE
jgi:hypothetical protein